MDFTQFSLNIQWNDNDLLHSRLVQTKFNMGTIDLDNHHQSFDSWSIARFRANVSWLSWPNSWFACNSAGHCLKFCDSIICCNVPTLNNPQDLRPDCLAVSFPVQWTRSHWSTSKRQCGVNGVQALRHAEMGSCYLITGECPAVILVQYVITVIHSVYFSIWLHKYKVKILDIDQLNCMLIDCWAQLSKDTLTRAIDHMPKDWWWLSRSTVLMFNFVWTNC